jgi:hypothetical protein
MKKLFNIYFVFIILFFIVDSTLVFATPLIPTDTGKIKKQETTITLFNKDGTINNCKVYSATMELSSFIINKYSKTGKLIESVSYKTSGKQIYKNKIIYDANDSLKTYEQMVTYSETGGISTSTSTYFNAQGEMERLVKCHIENAETNQLHCDTSYLEQKNNNDGRISEITNKYNVSGVPMLMKMAYSYDSITNTESTFIFFNDTLQAKTVYSRDKENRYTKSTSYGQDGSMTGYETFEYNKKGNVLITKSFGPDGKNTGKVVLINDKNGNPIKIENSNENGTVIYKETYTYKYSDNKEITESELVKYY